MLGNMKFKILNSEEEKKKLDLINNSLYSEIEELKEKLERNELMISEMEDENKKNRVEKTKKSGKKEENIIGESVKIQKYEKSYKKSHIENKFLSFILDDILIESKNKYQK